MKIKFGLFLTTIILCVGCANLSSTVDTFDAQGKLLAHTTMHVSTLWDAQSQLTKAGNGTGGTNKNGTSYGAGTSIQGLDQSASSSNLVVLLQAAAAIAAKMP